MKYQNESPFDDTIEPMKCKKCGITEEETALLQKCSMCHQHYCQNCAVFFGGRSFCSKTCGEYFFFSDEE